jgi:hypothetical protein
MMGFESEYPPRRLQEFGRMARSGSLGYFERWLLFCYCVAVARITLNTTSDIVNSTREVYEGTSIGGTLERYLDTIERRKSDGTSYDQMEAG